MPPRAASRLLADPDVLRWYQNLARGSRASADINLRRLDAFCRASKTTPASLLTLAPKQLHANLLDFVAAEETRGVAGSYIGRSIVAVRSWLSHNGIRVDRPLKIKGARDAPTLREERVPTPEELRRIFLAGTPKMRVACALVAFAGVRPEVLGNYDGSDGLTLSDLPELVIDGAKLRFTRIPTVVRIRPALSKNSNGYLSFLGAEGCEYVVQYLEERARSLEKLGPNTDLIHPERGAKRFIRTINIGDTIRTAIRAAGFAWRPYVLRHYFDTQLLTAESRGKVAHDFRVYWMGHAGAIDARYTTNKRQLPKDFVEEMRSAYQRCEPFLSSGTPPSGSPTQGEVLRMILSVMGYGAPELSQISDAELTVERVRSLIGRKAGGSPSAERVVTLGDLPGYLGRGWQFVSVVGSEQAVVRFGGGAWTRASPEGAPVPPSSESAQ